MSKEKILRIECHNSICKRDLTPNHRGMTDYMIVTHIKANKIMHHIFCDDDCMSEYYKENYD